MIIRFKMILVLGIICVSFISFETVFAGNPPYPASSVITDINFDSSIVRKARGGDNWPVTWGADDKIYTALGDGYGFAELGDKQSLGISRVSGAGDSFSGEDMGTVKWISEGSPPIKGTGILMIGGDLYLWSRRDNSSLRKSTDNGANWSSPILKMKETESKFYAIHFLQFGANHANARDDYIYMYATNQFGSYENYAYLIRVSSTGTAIENEDNYEYFTGTASSPTWSYEKADAVPVITDVSHKVLDVRAVYNPGIDRYIVTYNDYNTPGFMAILDAPEPWGPWTTVYYAEPWDQGFTFEYSFPAKWISSDGKTMYLVFSGTGVNDAFCVRKTILTINTSGTDITTTFRPAAPTGLRFINYNKNP
jgi:hypothetical protein